MQRSPVSPPSPSKMEESSSLSNHVDVGPGSSLPNPRGNVNMGIVRQELGRVRDDEKPAAAALKRFEHRREDINASAEAFIQRFRHQLHIQRVESIDNYEQMLARGL